MSSHCILRGLRDRRGSTLVEFSLVCFLLVMLLIGVVEISRLALVYTTIANAARVGVRYAMVHGTNNPPATSVADVVKGYLHPGMINTATSPPLTVTVSYPDTGTCKDPGCRVTVSVSYVFDPFTNYFPLGGITLGSTSQGVIVF